MLEFSFTKFLIGLGMVAVGILMVKYTMWFRNATGPQHWLEQYTGEGSTYGVYKLLGSLLGVFGFLTMTGLMDGIISALVQPFADTFGGISGGGPDTTPEP